MKQIFSYLLLMACLFICHCGKAQSASAHHEYNAHVIDSSHYARSVIAIDGVLYNQGHGPLLSYHQFIAKIQDCQAKVSLYTSPKKIKELFNINMPADKKTFAACYCTTAGRFKQIILPPAPSKESQNQPTDQK